MLNTKQKMQLKVIYLSTVDPWFLIYLESWLSGIEMTALLESSVYKCMDFNYPNCSIIWKPSSFPENKEVWITERLL